jgi:hypothetical protein
MLTNRCLNPLLKPLKKERLLPLERGGAIWPGRYGIAPIYAVRSFNLDSAG